MAKPKQHIPKHLRYTKTQFEAQFPSDDICLEHIKENRWPHGVTFCEKCQKERKHHRVTGRTAYACDYCGTHIYPLAGTIFEKTSTPLTTWFYAMYLMAQTRCGISAKQIQRETGVTYKTAWRMFKQIRTLFGEEIKLSGPELEMDETYVGGRRHRKYQARRGRPSPLDTTKTCVVGAAERKGRVLAAVVNDATRATLHGFAQERILPETTIFTDEHHSYTGLEKIGYTHHRVNHTAGVYVVGNVHTNTIEGFWSLVKRGIGGVYHSVSRKYLQTYLDEYSFRYNRRDSEIPMFTLMLSRVWETAEKRVSPKQEIPLV